MPFVTKHAPAFIGVLSLVIGVVAFSLIANIAIVDPRNVAWLIENNPDSNFLSWQFFRDSPLLQWPIGANPSYGMEMSSSIVYTDPIPIFALLFKPISSFLPFVFQYVGFWILLCFMLQSYFAGKLLSNFIRDPWLLLIGSTFFVIAPFFLWRLREHYALFGQWVVLAALHLYFRKTYSTMFWLTLLGVSALIHPYLLIMVTGIWSADLIKRLIVREMPFFRIVIGFAVGMAVILFVMWSAGYFIIQDGLRDGGFGIYRMNVLSMIDSDDIWSRVLRDIKGGRGEYEGFNYLGIGMILLLLLSAFKLLQNNILVIRAKNAPLCVLSIIFFVFALSNNIAVGTHVILSYPLPSFMNIVTDLLRVSGRFMWPVSYLTYVIILYIVFTTMDRRIAIVVCGVVLLLQVADTSRVFSQFNEKFHRTTSPAHLLRSSQWNTIASEYKKIIVIYPGNRTEHWMIFSDLAAAHKMSINMGYFARIDEKQLVKTRNTLRSSIINDNIDPKALYVFEDDLLWNVAAIQSSQFNYAGVLDGIRFLAPYFKRTAAYMRDTAVFAPLPPPVGFDYNGKIFFDTLGTGRNFCIYGWSKPEPTGTWSNGDSSLLLLKLHDAPRKNLRLVIDGQALLTEMITSRQVDVFLKGEYLQTLTYTLANNDSIKTITIPVSMIAENNLLLPISFHFHNINSLAELGISDDDRRLGLRLISLQILN